MKPIPEACIRAWVANHFEYRERRDGAELVICCPFDGDTDFKFNICPEKGLCHYWRGDTWAPLTRRGKRDTSFVRFVALYKRCSIAEAIGAITGEGPAKYLSAAAGKQTPADPETPGVRLPDGADRILESNTPRLARGLLKWLASRGYSEEDVRRCDLHHLGSDVIWPYHEYGELVYWQSRSRLNKRFLFPPKTTGVTKGHFFYGFDWVEPYEHLVITEAIFDAHTIRDQAVASGGADLTEHQIKKLKLLQPTKGVILAPDNDLAGRKSLVRNARLVLEAGWKVYAGVAPRLKYRDNRTGQEAVTKDWNEVGERVTGWEGARKLFEEMLEPVSPRLLVRLRGEILESERLAGRP